ncbi:hypothetical protein [Deinococcus peraridilitoris]|uniref:Uncharacterized protein n=1 Tax=Deinococcus peraridilitoris (strain DSM 19664 / LMG 22246 / CIP 109416 / KR-200) TaxID=937777 RepID=K9ZZ34_DEIPD|nr:hypothetical protein [Deinococcus peraridilitoris]AFZ66464.1 hypothetical protein Deipe_0895 [Deinococcus peraridilitoris DSM 19664]
MPVRIRIYGKEAIYDQGAWTCDDDSLTAMLQSMVDPRAVHTADHEREHALYAAGRFGGLILLETGWVPAEHPAPEITLEDLTGRKPGSESRSGLFSFFKRRPSR